MSIPSLPTDNLYKFMALSGLVLLTLSAYYPAQRIAELQLKQVNTSTEIALAKLEADEIGKELSYLEKQKSPDQAVFETLKKRQLQSQQSVVRIRGLAETQNVLLEQRFRLLVIGSIGLIAGSALSWYGFRLWYARVQRPMDAAVAKSVADA